MKRHAIHALLAITVFALAGAARAADAGLTWQTDYQSALKEAKASHKTILADFTGSDWCTWCIKLAKDTFSKPAFAKYASENLVLLELDYPQDKPQSDAVKKQNEELGARYKVEGYPTLVLINGDGEELDRNVGYLPGGPNGMIAWINKAITKK